MVFSNSEFLFLLLPITLILFYLFSFSKTIQNIVLLVFSLIFYALVDPRYVLVLTGMSLANWIFGLLMKSKNKTNNKVIMILGLAMNLSVFILFVYVEFILEQINEIGENNLVPQFSLLVPVALAYFVLSGISYIIDIYDEKAKASINPLDVMLYQFFFPKMICGPVVKYHDFKNQLYSRNANSNLVFTGILRIIEGLAKYVFIVKYLERISDAIFNWSEFGTAIEEVSVLTAWMGVISFCLYIYLYYSAFSDVSIGLSRVFGFEFSENYNCPYQAVSVTDFWNRWNISLIDWFKTYVYRIDNSKKLENMDLMVKNMFIMWILIGLWHGASWNFIFWGLLNFVLLLGERFFKINEKNVNKLLMRFYTLIFVIIGWVLLKTDGLYHASIYFKNLLGLNGNRLYNSRFFFLFKEYWFFLLIALVICVIPWMYLKEKLVGFKLKSYIAEKIFASFIIMALIVFSGFNLLENSDEFNNLRRKFLRIDSLDDYVAWVEDFSEDYNDNMILRWFCTETEGVICKVIGKNEMNGFQILVDSEGMMYQGTIYNEPMDYVDELTTQTYLLNKLVDESGSKLIVLIPPGKNLYGKANVDYDLPLSDKNPAMDKYYSNLQQRGIDYIDYRWIFSKTDVNHNQLYYKTDHRWKAYAAFIACQELVKHIENKYGEVMDYNKYYTDYSNYDTLVYYDAILGTYGKKTGYIYSGLDSLELICPLNYQDSDYTWIYNENGDTFELRGNLLDTLMFNAADVDEYFAGYDSCLDMYMDELHEKDTVINNNNPEGIKVAVLGDYYFSPMACFLAPMCSQMDIYDIRNNSMQSEFVELVKDGDYDYVILEMYPGSLKKGSFSFFETEEN